MDQLIPVVGTAPLLGSALIGGIFFAFSSFIMRALAAVPSEEGIAAMQSIRFRCSLLTRLTRTPPALSARTSLSGSRTPSPRPSTHQEDPSGGRGRPTKRDVVPAGYTLLESGRRC